MRRLLLDFGGVVIKTPFETLERVGRPPWLGPFDPESDSLWRRLQVGAMSERDYWHTRASELFPSSEDPIRELMAILFAPPAAEVVRPETMELVKHAERPAVLTNDLSRFHDKAWLIEMGIDGVFDPLIDLSYVGYIKPDPRAFDHALGLLEEQPGNVVFVDDQPHNVEGARSYGLTSIWFDVTDPEGSVGRVLAEL